MQNENVDKRRVRKIEQLEEDLRASDELPYDEAVDDGPILEVSLEELYEEASDEDDDLAFDEIIDTKHTDGSTTNPQQAWEQGLVYTPPDDPPVIASDNLQNAEIAAGFAQSMEATNTDYDSSPKQASYGDLDLEDEIKDALRYNSEAAHLELGKLEIHINNGVIYLYGFVPSEDDIALVDNLLRDLDGVTRVENFLEVEDLDNDTEK